MKVRFTSNNIRLRLTRDEVNALASGQTISTSADISVYDKLVCELVPWFLEIVEAKFNSGKLTVNIPQSFAALWPLSEQISLEKTQDNGSASSLKICIEKDFDKTS